MSGIHSMCVCEGGNHIWGKQEGYGGRRWRPRGRVEAVLRDCQGGEMESSQMLQSTKHKVHFESFCRLS